MHLHRFLLIIIVLSSSVASGQTKARDEVKLVDWKAQPCDDTYDPGRLVSRITSIRESKGITSIVVNFATNCCLDFEPSVQFSNNQLQLKFIDKYDEAELCFCVCCFSIEYQVSGLVGKKYDVYFADKKIEQSSDHYKLVEPQSESYQGKVINRRNKYGFKEGLWMNFYDDGSVKSTYEFPETVLYRQEQSIKEAFYWHTKGADSLVDINHSLHTDLNEAGIAYRIRYLRDEVNNSGGIARDVPYSWVWDEQTRLKESPPAWTEAFPWEKFPWIKVYRK